MTLTLRGYRDEDFAAVVELWNACHLLRPHHDPKRELAFVHAATNAELFLAFEEEKLAGSIHVGHDAHRAWMYHLGVAPALRRRGIGRALVAHAESWALARALPKLMLLIREENKAVSAFYARLGYGQEPRLVMSKSFGAKDRPGPDAMIDVVVTHLEMTEAPTRATVPLPAGVRLAVMRAEGPSTEFYRFLYDQVGDPWFWYERKQMTDKALAAILNDPAVELYLLHVAGAPAGYAEIDRRQTPEVALAYFGLIPRYTGRGLGWYFLNWAIDTAWTGGTTRLTVNTCTLDHPKALQIYQRAGFTPLRQEHLQILDPRLTGKTPKDLEPRRP
jgi:GNAT superfamily N-acetyltransferase